MALLILSDSNVVTSVALWSLVPSTVAFVFVVFVFYRSRREALVRQKEAELKQQLAEVEMKALRAQMNPHFIFNCLNSIYRFLEKQDTAKAGDYLLKFSQLIRTVLENSMHREVSLQDDLKTLHLYIQMEQMRMNQRFDYTISTDEKLDESSVLVPPLIIQPFVENSIWHGLNDKKERGNISIHISKGNEMLKYLVEDNGEEKKEPEAILEQTIKKKSLGMSITRERLDVLNKTKNAKADFRISDIRDGQGNYKGKRIELWIPVQTID
jgi:LytS/YehU family sensor histidine kinase